MDWPISPANVPARRHSEAVMRNAPNFGKGDIPSEIDGICCSAVDSGRADVHKSTKVEVPAFKPFGGKVNLKVERKLLRRA